jgi:FAD/FMN-containing dehydrogenase
MCARANAVPQPRKPQPPQPELWLTMPPVEKEVFLQTLRAIVGAPHVLTEGDLSAWEQDWRKRERGQALAVVRPASTDEVAQVVRACATARISLVPQGGNTGMVVGSTPDGSGRQVLLSLTRMQRIRQLDAANLTVTVEAGCVLQTLQEACEEAGFLYPLRMASEGSCTVGGNLGTNAGGTQVLRYGNTRELCLGLEVVTAAGEVWSGLSGLRKDNTGYDLRHLFIGSEGTLGVITAAVLKLYPLPKSMLTAYAAVPSLDAAVALLGLAHQRLSSGLTGFEVMGHFALSLVRKHFPQQAVPFAEAPYCVVLELSDHDSEAHARSLLENLLEAALQDGCVQDAVVAQTQTQARALWHIRESIPLAQAQEGLNIKHDISIAVSRIPDFVRETDAAIQQNFPGARMVNYGHLGDGNLHYNVQAPEGANAEAFLREQEKPLNTLVYAQVDKYHGSISAEHGIGSLKREKLAEHKSPVALALMRSIKQALDPHNLMNPGRMLKL